MIVRLKLASTRPHTKGCPEVRATRNLQLGASTTIVRQGALGYVISQCGNRALVFWRGVAGDDSGRSGTVPYDGLKYTGNKG